jgi:branched-chain amino acid transport system permease protein
VTGVDRGRTRSLLTPSTPLRAYGTLAVVVAVLALVPPLVGGSRYLVGVASLLIVLACHGVGFNLIFGGTGQLLLSVGAVAAVAAYTSALLGNVAGWPLVVTLPVGVAGAAALGAVLSWVAVRRSLTTIFVGVVSLTASLVVHNLLLGQRELTGGETGLIVEGGAGTVLRDPVVGFYVLLGVLVAGVVGHRAIERSWLGWACRALRDDADGAALAGIDVARTKIAVAAIGSGFIGFAGAAYAHTDGFVSPTTYAFATVDVRVIVVVVLGGLGTVLGPVVGAVVVTVLDEVLRPLGQLRLAVYGALLLVLFLGVPRGLLPTLHAVRARLRRRLRPVKTGTSPPDSGTDVA